MNALTTQEGLSQLDQAISKMRKNIAEHIGAVLDATFPTVEIPENIYKLLLEVFSDME